MVLPGIISPSASKTTSMTFGSFFFSTLGLTRRLGLIAAGACFGGSGADLLTFSRVLDYDVSIFFSSSGLALIGSDSVFVIGTGIG